MTKIDEIDLKILNELIVDAKKAYTQIAKDLSISNTLVHQRIAKKSNSILKHWVLKPLRIWVLY